MLHFTRSTIAGGMPLDYELALLTWCFLHDSTPDVALLAQHLHCWRNTSVDGCAADI